MPRRPNMLNYGGSKVGIASVGAAGVRARARPPGTEFLDAETRRQKESLKRANARRDQKPATEWPKIPAETHYLASSRKRAVCGDWMVVCAVVFEPVSAAIPHWKTAAIRCFPLSLVKTGNSNPKDFGFRACYP